MTKMPKDVNLVSRKKNHKDPYGIFKGSRITEKDINEVTSSLDKVVDELVQSIKPQKHRIYGLTKIKY